MRKRYFVYLVYLIIITFIVTSVSLSRYSTTVQSEGSVTVAKPVISYTPRAATLNGEPITDIGGGISLSDIDSGDILVYTFDISNFDNTHVNQVLLKYKLTVSMNPDTINLPLLYSIEPAASYESAGGNWIYMGFDEQITHSYTLTVSWDADNDAPEYAGKEQKLQITIDTQQADSTH